MTNIQDFYRRILTGLRYRVDEDGLISFLPPDGGAIPATVEKRRLVLPTKERLREGIDDTLQPFHPLSESIARKGASPVLTHMQRTAKAVLAHYTVEIATHLLAVATNPVLHKDLPPNCSAYLKKLPNADKKSLQDFVSIVEKAALKSKLITLYLKHGGKLEGTKFNRVCTVHFPLLELFNTEDESVLGMKLRKKDMKTFQALLHHVIPFGDDPEYYSAGSNSRIAPYFDSFMQAYTKVATQLNKILKQYAKAIDLNLPELPLDYLDDLADLGQFYEQIPPLRGNEGIAGKDDEEVEAPASAKAASALSSVYDRINEPVRPAAPIRTIDEDRTPPWESRPNPRDVREPVRSPGGGISMADFRTSLNPVPTAGYSTHPAPTGYGYQPQPSYGYGQQQQDPRRPSWLVGQAPQQQQSPFAQAFQMQPAATIPSSNYGGYPNSNSWSGGSRL